MWEKLSTHDLRVVLESGPVVGIRPFFLSSVLVVTIDLLFGSDVEEAFLPVLSTPIFVRSLPHFPSPVPHLVLFSRLRLVQAV